MWKAPVVRQAVNEGKRGRCFSTISPNGNGSRNAKRMLEIVEDKI